MAGSPVYGNYITILSIDGGGVKGIIPAIILGYLEAALQKKDKNTYIKDYFDVIAGTSTGGLVTSMLSAPNPEDTSAPLFVARQIKDFYKDNCPKIFPPVSNQWAMLVQPIFDGEYLHEIIRQELKETRLHETLTNVVIPTFDIKLFRPTIFSSFKWKKNRILDALLSDICIGTSAAPISLPAYYFENEVEDSSTSSVHKAAFNLIDGGCVAGNPALLAISDVTQQSEENPEYLSTKANDYSKILLLSLGTGTSKNSHQFDAETVAKWGLIQWVLTGALIDSYSDANADMTDYYLATVFQSLQAEDNYLRIQEYDLPSDISAMDGSTENMERLEQIGNDLLDKNVMRMNVQTFTPEETNLGTNATALDKLADVLYEERQQRLAKRASLQKKRKTID